MKIFRATKPLRPHPSVHAFLHAWLTRIIVVAGIGLGLVTEEEISTWSQTDGYKIVEDFLKSNSITPLRKPSKAKATKNIKHLQDYNVLLFDLETTGLRKDAEITQIACVSLTEEKEFSCYIRPNGSIGPIATKITGLSIGFSKGA